MITPITGHCLITILTYQNPLVAKPCQSIELTTNAGCGTSTTPAATTTISDQYQNLNKLGLVTIKIKEIKPCSGGSPTLPSSVSRRGTTSRLRSIPSRRSVRARRSTATASGDGSTRRHTFTLPRRRYHPNQSNTRLRSTQGGRGGGEEEGLPPTATAARLLLRLRPPSDVATPVFGMREGEALAPLLVAWWSFTR